MTKLLALLITGMLCTFNGFAQEQTGNASQAQDSYTKTINARAEKIVSTLNITDPIKASKVQSIIANQYRNLNELHTDRDEAIKKVKAANGEKSLTDSNVKQVQSESAGKIEKLHKQYIQQLSAELSEEQVIKVKDGMTYNVVNLTYNGYLDMLPNLTVEQKRQIRAWLEEAREYAMDAETSEKKHAWFGKYKGRINNYLSAAGYDLKKEGEAWQKRIKEREEKKNTSKD